MKVTCLTDNLLKAISASERLVGKKESLPVLSCFLLEVTKQGLILRATNLEAGIEIAIPGENTEPGTVAVPAQVLGNILRITRGDKITISADESTLSIVAASGTTSIRAIPHEEFPPIPFLDDTNLIEMSRQALVDGIQSVLYAASHSMVRPELASVSVSYLEGSLVFAATDSFRLAEKKVQTAMSNEFSDILLPQKNASELVHVLASLSEDTVSISTDDSQLYLKSMSALSVRFISRVIDASFPNYREILPKAFTTEATILTKDLSSVLKKAKLFSNASQQVSFHIYPKKKVFSVTAQNQDVGEMDELIEAAVTGEDIDINFNSTYVGDSLQSIHADSLTFSFAGNGKPLVIRPIGDLSFMYLVMPLNR